MHNNKYMAIHLICFLMMSFGFVMSMDNVSPAEHCTRWLQSPHGRLFIKGAIENDKIVGSGQTIAKLAVLRRQNLDEAARYAISIIDLAEKNQS